MQAISILLQYVGEHIALFSGGLFTGATLYICLTERPPRTALGLTDLLTLSRITARRTNAFLTVLAAVTAFAALLAAFSGAGIWWRIGGLAHLAAVILLLTKVQAIAKELEEPEADHNPRAAGRKLLKRQTAYFSALCLIGLAAQYLFIAKP